jgi:uncharacterized protein (TIGR00255 family)
VDLSGLSKPGNRGTFNQNAPKLFERLSREKHSMTKSMTGYGEAMGIYQGQPVKVEIRTLNNRYRDMVIRGPRCLTAAEEPLKKILSAQINRGRTEMWVQIDPANQAGGRLVLNLPKAMEAVDLLNQLKTETSIDEPITLAHLLSLNVLSEPDIESDFDLESFWPVVNELTQKALSQVLDFRTQEGLALEKDLLNRLDLLESGLKTVIPWTEKANDAIFQKLSKRLADLIQDKLDMTKLTQDVALLADKMDISEEITRFSGHIAAFRRILTEPGPIGRRLEFLLQELHREANTMGAKSQTPEITQEVLIFKSELEKMREQIQNIE